MIIVLTLFSRLKNTEAEIWIDWALGQLRGLRKVVVLLQANEVFEWDNDEMRTILMDADSVSKTHSFLQQLKSSKWYNQDEMPFGVEKIQSEAQQLSLTRESGVNVLALKSNETGIILLLYLDSPSRHFGISLNETHFSASNRKVLEQLLTASMNQFARHRTQQLELEQKLLDFQLYLKEKLKQAQEKIKTSELVHQQNRQALIVQLFRDAAFKREIKLQVSKEAREFMTMQTGDLNHIQSLIEQILDHLMFIYRGQDQFLVEESDIEWVISEMKKEVAPILESDHLVSPIGRLSRTRLLLDRYEEAARIAVYHQEEINGKNIARYCNPPVTNASISDALKKHKDRLIELLNLDRESWPLLRSRFKSLHRMADSASEKMHSA